MTTERTVKRIQLALRLAGQSSRLLFTLLACVLCSGALAFRRAPFSVTLVNWPSKGVDRPLAFQRYLLEASRSIRTVKIDLYQAEYALTSQREGPLESAQETADQRVESQVESQASAHAQPPQPTLQSQAPMPFPPLTHSHVPTPTVPPAVPTTAANPGVSIDAALEMRVAIAKDEPSLAISSSTPAQIIDANGVAYNLPAQTTYDTQPHQSGIRFGDWNMAHAIWIQPSKGGYVYVGDRWFRGRLLLIRQDDRLLAVNYVLLRDYLFSVVGSEMYLDWPIESLRAQAVAARSYALAHHVRPASSNYDLDNTQRFQAYKGVAREANTTHTAVQSTSGEFISYRGGIVESLYAASDQIVIEAHGGQGMSQHGAMELAQKGYNYQQILGTYYPGTGLARLEVQQ
ncbi:MAG: SpoIID/LytB domain-containing protein [Leptolyngbyaceae cyanobacterium MO_188.B28]|nr:SpoIID/LytB domain-containing protein [Leptolyngbyaceae cyanobacterium MO_188.B28]